MANVAQMAGLARKFNALYQATGIGETIKRGFKTYFGRAVRLKLFGMIVDRKLTTTKDLTDEEVLRVARWMQKDRVTAPLMRSWIDKCYNSLMEQTVQMKAEHDGK